MILISRAFLMTAVPTNEGSEATAGPTRRQQLEHHLKTCPTDRDSYLELATIYREENRPLQAAKILRQAHETFPDDSSLLWELEEAQLARSVQQLVEVRDLATRLGNSSADHELERATADWGNCRLKVCRARLNRDPSLTYLRMVLGEALYDLERYDEAIDELEPLLDSETHSPGAYLLTGRCQLLLSQDMAAMKSLRQASIRRAVIGPAKTRSAALKLLIDLADRHGLSASLQFYQQSLQAIS
jgi:tetratricopeptide (TPR) repeat protein|tara:strand:- start:22571 stop:23302 length:732 start_codon:yes stop_codon:yes gene_type:complete